MLVELEKDDIINLIKNTSPPYALINEFEEKKYGSLCGGFAEKWKWNCSKLLELSETDLYAIYQKLKKMNKGGDLL